MLKYLQSQTDMQDEVGYFGNGAVGVPSLISHVGAGEWLDVASTFNQRSISCQQEIQVTDMAEACGTLSLVGDETGKYVALPMLSDDRFIYRSELQQISSISHYRFDATGHLYWILSNFADMNPNAYKWLSLQSAIDIFRDLPEESALETLVQRGTVRAWWPENNLGDPIPGIERGPQGLAIQVNCDDPGIITKEQCQGACYYQGYTHSILYGVESRIFKGECHCGRGCDGVENSVFSGTYDVWKWQEGFFYNDETFEVWILAKTFSDDLNIYMWVTYVDHCGNEGSGKVEFWIAPSVEAAAAQGRSCDEADTDPEGYILPFAFTSDDRITTENGDNSTFNEVVDDQMSESDWNGDGGPPPLEGPSVREPEVELVDCANIYRFANRIISDTRFSNDDVIAQLGSFMTDEATEHCYDKLDEAATAVMQGNRDYEIQF